MKKKNTKDVLTIVAIILVSSTTFLQVLVDYIQSKYTGESKFQRILLTFILGFSLVGMLLSWYLGKKHIKILS